MTRTLKCRALLKTVETRKQKIPPAIPILRSQTKSTNIKASAPKPNAALIKWIFLYRSLSAPERSSLKRKRDMVNLRKFSSATGKHIQYAINATCQDSTYHATLKVPQSGPRMGVSSHLISSSSNNRSLTSAYMQTVISA